MNVSEARRFLGPDTPHDVLEEWVRVYNLRRETFVSDDPTIPKGETILIEKNPDK